MSLESRLAALETRNKKVDTNKAWETSLTRRFSIVAIAYYHIILVLFQSIAIC